MPYQPMLASSSAPRRLIGRWVLEPKVDGWRIIVGIDGNVRVWTRRGHAYPSSPSSPSASRATETTNVRIALKR